MKSLALAKLVNRLTFGHVKYGWWTAGWTSDERPIVIGGSERSGTTLLQELLSAHEGIYIAGELGILANNRNIELPSAGMTAARIRQTFRRSVTLGDFFERFNIALMEEAGKKRWGDKSPSNVQNLRFLFRSFPHAHFIHAIRDGRDVVCSLRTNPKYRWVDGRRVETGVLKPWDTCIDAWVHHVKLGLEYRDDQRCFEVRYESLVADPQATLRPLLEWLRIPWDPLMLENYRTDRYVLQPRLAGPIDRTAVQRWRRDLPREARRAFRGKANDLLITLGYVGDESWIDDPLSD